MAHREWIQSADEVTGLLATVVWRIEGPEPSQDSRLDRVRCGLAQVISHWVKRAISPRGAVSWGSVDSRSCLRALENIHTIGPCLDLRDDLQAYLRRGLRAGESVELVHVAPLIASQEAVLPPQPERGTDLAW